MRNDRDDQDDGLAELFEQFFESVSYHGMKRGMARFAKGLAPGQSGPPREDEAEAELEGLPPDGTARLPVDGQRERPAIPPPAGAKLPAPLVKRLGRSPRPDPRQSPAGDESAEETREPEP